VINRHYYGEISHIKTKDKRIKTKGGSRFLPCEIWLRRGLYAISQGRVQSSKQNKKKYENSLKQVSYTDLYKS